MSLVSACVPHCCVARPQYNRVLEEKKGTISEFVNPKYKPNTNNTVFNKPTRLECMMQDYPKLLGQSSLLISGMTACHCSQTDKSARVSFTQFERWTSFSAVKNTMADGAAKQKAGSASAVSHRHCFVLLMLLLFAAQTLLSARRRASRTCTCGRVTC